MPIIVCARWSEAPQLATSSFCIIGIGIGKPMSSLVEVGNPGAGLQAAGYNPTAEEVIAAFRLFVQGQARK